MKNAQTTFVNYITTNKTTGKQYIGTHKLSKHKDSYIGSGRLIKEAIEEYGKDDFICEVLLINQTEKQARDMEAKLISKTNTIAPYGYNLSPTGGCHKGGKHHQISKDLITGRPQKLTYEQIRDYVLEHPYLTAKEVANHLDVVVNTLKHRFLDKGYGNFTEFKWSHGLLT